MTPDNQASKRPRTLLLFWASVALFGASLAMDCFYIDRPDNPGAWALGLGLLFVGWIELGLGVFAWLANPALLLAWILLLTRCNRAAAVSAGFALAFALSFLLHKQIVASGSGEYERITGYGPGYWSWVASMAVVLIASIAAQIRTVKQSDR